MKSVERGVKLSNADDKNKPYNDLVQLARLALSGRPQDIQLYLRRVVRRIDSIEPDAARQILDLLRESPVPQSPFRTITTESIPVDQDTKLSLVRHEYPVELDVAPVWPPDVESVLSQLITERLKEAELQDQGLTPTRTALFVGKPGVGKTLAARYIAAAMGRPLLTLDLAAVMSSFLGRTGNNLRFVLDYAKNLPCVLLLDELDAVAKRRDDDVEVGELKRLVTVLLQEIDDWPTTGLLLAATNHPDLLDPAVWRRFEIVLQMPLPKIDQMKKIIDDHLQGTDAVQKPLWASALSQVFLANELSFSDVQRELTRARREAVVGDAKLDRYLMNIIRNLSSGMKRQSRMDLAASLIAEGLSQRQVHDLTGVSRDTIRKSDRTRTGQHSN